MSEKVTTSSAIPVTFGNAVQKLAAIAFLMDCTQAKAANNYLVVLVVIVVETGITNDVIIYFVLINPNLFVRISGVDFFLIRLLGFVSLINLHKLGLFRIFLNRFLFCIKLARHTLIQSSDPKLSLLG